MLNFIALRKSAESRIFWTGIVFTFASIGVLVSTIVGIQFGFDLRDYIPFFSISGWLFSVMFLGGIFLVLLGVPFAAMLRLMRVYGLTNMQVRSLVERYDNDRLDVFDHINRHISEPIAVATWNFADPNVQALLNRYSTLEMLTMCNPPQQGFLLLDRMWLMRLEHESRLDSQVPPHQGLTVQMHPSVWGD